MHCGGGWQAFGRAGTALLLAVPWTAVDPPTQAEVDAAIERGVEHLRMIYLEGGGRGGARAFGQPSILHHPGLHALALYALIRAEVPHDDAAVQRLLARLALDPIETTYDASGLVLALCALDPVEHRMWLAELSAKLVSWQEEAGDWGYPDGGDLSNTQFAGLALHALADAGLELEPQLWNKLAHAVLRYRAKDGGFVYAVGARKATGSMTTAGVATLALCELELARSDALPAELRSTLRDAQRAGIDWLIERFEPDSNPKNPAWVHYWLYGVERVGAFCRLERFGARDWYAEGARFLVDTQRGDGAWAGTFERIPTVFALLFLRRATRPHVPTTGPRAAAGEQPARPRAPAWMLALESEPALTRVPTEHANAKASSTLYGAEGLPAHGCGARFALDGNRRAPWIAEADDEEPLLTIRLRRGVFVGRARVHLARLLGDTTVGLGLPAAVELRADRGEWARRAVGDDPRRPLEWDLSGHDRVRTLELRLIGADPEGAPVGIGEVELLR